MQTNALEEAELTDNSNEPEPQPETSEPTPTPEPETTALIPAEPEIIEGEVIAIEPPESTQNHTLPKQKPYWLLIPFTVFLCLAFVAISLLLPLLTPTATVIIIPVEKNVSFTTAILVHGRPLPTLTLSQSQTVPATGHRHQDATRAIGTITFYNGLFISQTIAAGTILTGATGVQIITDQPAVIPAGNPPIYGQVTVSAHAVITGTSGNIPAYDINTACCVTSVLAKNTEAFTGGQNARDYIVVTKSDIASAAGVIKSTLLKSEDAALSAQLTPGEALIIPACTPTTTSDHRIGEEAKEVTVTLSETCTSIAYPAHDVYQDATQLIPSNAKQTLGANYQLTGDIQIHVIQATITNQARGIATLTVKLNATYVYHLSPGEKQQLEKLIAGKPKAQAIQDLLQLPGVQGASINNTTAMLPTDPTRITIVVEYRD